ncbi:MAG: YraN family protein [Candidatus Moranbacteria bacterium]|nr:YraN family protein [Candidatus Moranbacteria bacterium]
MDQEQNKKIGKQGEIIAANYLKQNGYRILDMNFQNKFGYRVGELDIVASEEKTGEIAFVEVKTRRKGSPGSANPELAITRAKYRRLTRILGQYLRQKHLEDVSHRLDAISIEMDMGSRKANLRHLKYIYY